MRKIEIGVFDLRRYKHVKITKHDFGAHVVCSKCQDYFRSINQNFRHNLIRISEAIKLDDGNYVCQNCAEKIINGR